MYVFSDDGDGGFFSKRRSTSSRKYGASFPKAEGFLVTETD